MAGIGRISGVGSNGGKSSLERGISSMSRLWVVLDEEVTGSSRYVLYEKPM